MAHSLALSRKQIDSIVEADRFLNVWEGSVRSGKTIGSLIRWLEYVADPPQGGELVMIGRTRDSLARNIFGPLTNPTIFGDLAQDIHYTSGAPTASVLGQTVHAIGANDAQAEPKIRGLTCAGAYGDELTTLPKAFFDQLTARCSVPGSKIFGTTNPDNPAHWLRQDYLLRPEETKLRSWHFVLDDNPGLSDEYKERAKTTHVGLFYKRNILGLWVQAEGAIYDMYDDERHIVTSLPEMRRYWVGIDYGTTNAFSALLMGHGVDDRLYVVSEWRHDSRTAQRQMTDAQYSRAVRGWLTELGIEPEWIFVDPSAASFSLQMWEDGAPGMAKATNDVTDGIRSVSSLLAAGRLMVHESCEGLITELPGYAWDQKASDAGEDKPLKVADHSCDALRYVVHSTAHEWRHLLTMPTAEEAPA